jgi:hypothetical protein
LYNAVSYAENITWEHSRDQDNLLSWQQMCAGMPFGHLFPSYEDQTPSFRTASDQCRWADESIYAGYPLQGTTLLDTIHDWLNVFSPQERSRDRESIETLFHMTLFTANRVLLTFYAPDVVSSHRSDWRGRDILTSPGQLVQKPVVSKAALSILTILLGLQLIGLAYLTYYIYHVPTWTGALDAMAVARIGASLAEHDVLPPIGHVSKKDLDALKGVDGLIGVVPSSEGRYAGSQTRLVPSGLRDMNESDTEMRPVGKEEPYVSVEEQGPQLGLGAPGVITAGTRKMELVRRRNEGATEEP